MEQKDFFFSIIMAIYNVDEFLEEAIESIINQSLDFEHHVQLILVNDGSEDASEDICLMYKEQYPNNIVYIHKENGGASSARNEGLKHAKGKYINFLDPDDTLSPPTLLRVYEFFEKNYSKIDVVSIPMMMFGKTKGPHLLNYKFDKTRLVNILKEHSGIQLSAPSSFVKKEAIEHHFFNEAMAYAEDSEWLTKVILKREVYGIVKEGQYNYRRREDASSATQVGKNDKRWYTDYLEKFSKELINHSIIKLGYVPKYIQYMLMYDIQWRINVEDRTGILTDKEVEEFFGLLQRILAFIDDEIIFEQKSINLHRKYFLVKLKYKNQKGVFEKIFLNRNVNLYFKDKLISSMRYEALTLELLRIENGVITLEGNFGSLFNSRDLEVKACVNKKVYHSERIDRPVHNLYCLNEPVKEYLGFSINIPVDELENSSNIEMNIHVKNKLIKVKINFGRLFPLDKHFVDFYTKDGISIYFDHQENNLVVLKGGNEVIRQKEKRIQKRFKKSNKVGAEKASKVRKVMDYLYKIKKDKKIWIFMDRINKADDNAEALFEYAMQQKDGIKKYFIISKDSPDYNRLKKIGPVVAYGSPKHKFLHLLADEIISSHADDYVVNPFVNMRRYYKDMFKFNFVFLQHGITKDDISGWLNKYKKNIRLFITAAQPEYDSIINGKYNYSEKEVILTGFPRFDKLVSNNKKKILIMPTWRNHLVGKINPQTGKRDYSPYFKESTYFSELNNLLNDSRLIDAAEKEGYEIIFFPHPNIVQQLKDFDRNESVRIADINESYRDHFNNSAILITDYSSVAFDFAYLKKPVFYFQYEKNHLEKGYFNYQTMGFGDVISDKETLVSKLIYCIKNNCRMDDIYINRVNKFYKYIDNKNCKRVYEHIVRIDTLHKEGID
ncbi:bifunctional glycosyltransferase family 2 protein/CDP-glycerol:glycerophosphate glycerophosphotransferase [Bacillus haynesii]|uniref:bifunctional glycosyltransferase/CDP-glycerol:glycerophosphate glycerophosphotransferase n=1 Tax=Bacillus haynesii TaxID=1925021 RepID=UPI0022815B9A|nr:CDP-glycerol glycerophosphotransferase family protein [Bacillus haynesii]MCY9262135.1 bifunctional glycosyltransferase family 2 protein/CDP-glycerol:glycerophosphate glycerophosphotransferase [Bacillus haynesii]